MQESCDVILAAFSILELLDTIKNYLLIILGFSVVVFFHELGHFLAAKWCDVRVDRFAVGFGKELFGFTRGETRYSFNVLPLGGYVKMLGQEDFEIDKSGELKVRDDPRAFTHKSVGQRMFIVSAGVIMNLIFASVVFMIVFMIGLEAPAARIGLVLAESPAAQAGLRVNDEIIAIDGRRASDYHDVMSAVLLADPGRPLRITVRRPTGEEGRTEVKTFDVLTRHNAEENKQMIGISPVFNNRVVSVMPDPLLKPEEQLRVGDEVLEINGQKVGDFYQINQALVRLKGEFADVKVRRQIDGQAKELHVRRRVRLYFIPTNAGGGESGHLLGLVPRREITVVNPESRADEAGLKPGDVIVAWGRTEAPTLGEILQSIQDKDNADRPIPVTVLRSGPDGTAEEIRVQVKPKASGFFRAGTPKVGMDPYGQESERLVVSDIVTKVTDEIATPAAALKDVMPRGALITKVNGRPVKTWSELVDRFIALGGEDVTLTWTYNGQQEESGVIHVPETLGTTFPLEPGERVTRIGDTTSIEDLVNGRPQMQSAETWTGARKILKKYMGQTITVEYRYLSDPAGKKASVTVTPEMLDTWVQRVTYSDAQTVANTLWTGFVSTRVKVSNPIVAMGIGLQKTYFFIETVYTMMKRMVFTRSVSFDQVSGPVGIVHMGSEVARQDFTMLLYFLAMISANLAVINFLPLPIVDGGLFTFLIIEKIKGSPISLRVMVATQVIGIVLIIGVFLFVTFQDLQKLVG